MSEENPFIPGAKVAVIHYSRHGKLVGEDVVAKVYKNGNFVLQNYPGGQQWTPWREAMEPKHWRGAPTGPGYNRPYVLIINEDTKSYVEAVVDESKRRQRFEKISGFFYHKAKFSDLVTAKMLDQIEAAIAPLMVEK